MKTPRLLNLTAKPSDMIAKNATPVPPLRSLPTKNAPFSATPQAPGDGCSILKNFRWAVPTFAIALSFSVDAQASPRVAATAVEAALPVATRVAVIEAAEKTAGAVVSRNVSTIVADSAAQAAARRAATAATVRTGSGSTESLGKILLRRDRSKEILALGASAGLGTGLYSGMSKTGDGIKSSLQEVGKGAGDAIRETPKSIPFLTAASAVTALVFVMLISRLIPSRKPLPEKAINRREAD